MMATILFFAFLFQITLVNAGEININCGADESVESYDNIVFLKDGAYSKGLGYGYNKIENAPRYDTIQIINLGDDLHTPHIYRTSLFGVDEYKIDLPNGEYFLSIHMYEPIYQTPGRRVFSVTIEGEEAVRDLDMVEQFGTGKIIQIRKKVAVSDGVMNIKFDASKGRSILTAIRCQPANNYNVLPKIDVDIAASYKQNIVHFPSHDYNIAYYNVYKKIDQKYVKINSNIFSQTFIDKNLTDDIAYYKFSATDFLGRESNLTKEYQISKISRDDFQIPSYYVAVDEDDIVKMLEDKYTEDYKNCVFADGQQSKNALIRLRGKSTRVFHKKSWKIKFDDDDKYEGKEKLNFLSLIFDPTMIREKLFHDVMREAVGFDLKYEYKNLFLNDEYIGLFLTKEQEDNEFLEEHDIDTGAVFKAIGSNTEPCEYMEEYNEAFEVQNNYKGDFADLHNFFTYVDTASVSELDANLDNIFYVEDFIKSRAMVNYFADNDQCRQNYILIYETENKKWRYVTYDNNFAMFNKLWHIMSYTKEFPDLWGCWFGIFEKVLQVPKYNYLYQSFVKILREEYCRPDKIKARIDNLADYVSADAERDPNKFTHADNVAFRNEIGYLKDYFDDRYRIVGEQLSKIAKVEIPDGISINEIMTNNVSALETEEGKYHNWIEFYNNADVPIDLVDFKLKIDQNGRNSEYHFPVNTVIQPYSFRVFLFEEGNDDEKKYINGIITPDKANLKLIRKTDGTVEDELALIGLAANNSYAELDNTSGQWMMFTLNTYNSSNIGMDKNVKIFINEFMAKNDSTLADEWGEYEDWIELYNPNNLDIDLSGYYLSDELEETDKWRIPNGTYIPANGFLLFWADKDEEQGDNHIDFKLSGDSGYVMLTNPYNNLIIDSIYYIDADTDESFARNGDGMPEWIKAHVPTPNRSNIYYNENTRYNIMDVYPNPADLYINVYFVLHRNKWAKLRICDFRGSTIRELYNGKYEAGEYSFRVDLSDLASGTYFLYFETKDHYEVKPFVKVE